MFHPGIFKLRCSNPRCTRRRVFDGYVEEKRERMLYYRTESLGALKLMFMRMINEEYYSRDQGDHHTYYCPACFEVKTVVVWRGHIVNLYTDKF
ncbi:MAG: hypothetical protein ABI977_05230 [Acidobacteriota bacterium]